MQLPLFNRSNTLSLWHLIPFKFSFQPLPVVKYEYSLLKLQPQKENEFVFFHI